MGFVLVAGFVSLGIYTGKTYFAKSPFPSERHFQFLYRATLAPLPPEASQIRIWIPLASTRDGQKILKREAKAPLPYEIHQEGIYGNEMLYSEANAKTLKTLTFEIDYEAVVDGKGTFVSEDSLEVKKFLAPSRLMLVNEEVKKRAELATRGKKNLWEKARGIYHYVIGHMVYDKITPGWGQGDTIRACLLGRGNCTDFHSLFISIAHAAEIPSRFKIGFTLPREGEGPVAGYHCWAEFFDEKRGWVPVDASEAWKNPRMKKHYFGRFDTNKFLLTLGRDIELVPKQAGEPVNIFIYPYVEVEGKPLAEGAVKTEFYFKNLAT